jgi:predicted PilT family ATPase
MIDAIIDTGLLKLLGKKRSGILVYGPPNIGKSTVVEMLRNIFHCDNYIIGKTKYAVGRISQ